MATTGEVYGIAKYLTDEEKQRAVSREYTHYTRWSAPRCANGRCALAVALDTDRGNGAPTPSVIAEEIVTRHSEWALEVTEITRAAYSFGIDFDDGRLLGNRLKMALGVQ